MNSIFLIIICITLFLILNFICKKSTKKSKLTNVSPDKTMIFYAPWCGHCKTAMPEFKKAAESSNGKIQMINSDAPGSKELMEKFHVNAFPTIMKATGEQYNGSNDAESLKNFSK